MVAKPRRQRLTVPLAPLIGAACGIALALLIVLTPVDALEDFIIQSGLPAILPAAEPPLGLTARLGLTMVGAGGVGLIGWFLLFLIVGSRTISFGSGQDDEDPMVPVLRRADAHPDAPARRPLFASEDLGTPFLQVSAPEPVADPVSFAIPTEQALDVFAPLPPARPPIDIPEDLDQPMAAYDPGAIPETPIEPPVMPRPIAVPRKQLYEAGERFETFELTPMVRRDPAEQAGVARRESATPRPNTEATISALLERLERSVTERTLHSGPASAPPAPANQGGSIDETLGALRKMATRAG